MKYQSVNHMNDFAFHDSVWKFVLYEAGTLVVRATELSVCADAPQNLSGCDMEIETARITFEGIEILSHKSSDEWKEEGNGGSADDAKTEFFREIRRPEGITVYSLEVCADGSCLLCAQGDDPFFETVFLARCMRIEWDALLRPAWYIREPRKE